LSEDHANRVVDELCFDVLDGGGILSGMLVTKAGTATLVAFAKVSETFGRIFCPARTLREWNRFARLIALKD
jgi:hypothetical protein